ncbi:hypothetical protein EUGRSUZ_C01775 [Eucalyptus grandis]|uniref:Cytochrome P450 n=2 Tax=Eucalyptus grandis TaxID=71139 RepID=A0A059CQE7_EUCGR|nr:hypothetical protein EUGRSUZ_C01775 [Eucalyptus grandis]
MGVQLIVALICALVIPLLAVFFIDTKKKTRAFRNLPPGPRKLPIIGNLHQLGSLPHRSLARLSKQYGQIMLLHLGSIPTLVISSEDVAREVFKDHDTAFSGRPIFYAGKKLAYNQSDITFSTYGESWKELKKLVTQELLNNKRVKSFESVRKDEVKLMLDAITSSPDLFPYMAWFNRLNGFNAKVEKNFMELDKFYDEVIEQHQDPQRPKLDHEDLVDVLLRLQRDPNQMNALTREQFKGVLTNIFNAGTGTSATTILWAMAELVRNPAVMRKAQEEVREVAKGKLHVEETDLLGLTYLRSVIKETLRLHPPLPLLVPRATIEDCKIRGYTVPRGTTVFVNVLEQLHRFHRTEL